MPLCGEVCYKVGSFLHGSSVGSYRKSLGELDEYRLLGELWLLCSYMFEHPYSAVAPGSEDLFLAPRFSMPTPSREH